MSARRRWRSASASVPASAIWSRSRRSCSRCRRRRSSADGSSPLMAGKIDRGAARWPSARAIRCPRDSPEARVRAGDGGSRHRRRLRVGQVVLVDQPGRLQGRLRHQPEGFRKLGTDIASDITGAGTKTDAELAKEFRAWPRVPIGSRRSSRPSSRRPSTASGWPASSPVSTPEGRPAKIATAATKHDASSAETATRSLLVDAAKIKTADTSLSKDLGLPAGPGGVVEQSTASTSSSVSATSTPAADRVTAGRGHRAAPVPRTVILINSM